MKTTVLILATILLLAKASYSQETNSMLITLTEKVSPTPLCGDEEVITAIVVRIQNEQTKESKDAIVIVSCIESYGEDFFKLNHDYLVDLSDVEPPFKQHGIWNTTDTTLPHYRLISAKPR